MSENDEESELLQLRLQALNSTSRASLRRKSASNTSLSSVNPCTIESINLSSPIVKNIHKDSEEEKTTEALVGNYTKVEFDSDELKLREFALKSLLQKRVQKTGELLKQANVKASPLQQKDGQEKQITTPPPVHRKDVTKKPFTTPLKLVRSPAALRNQTPVKTVTTTESSIPTANITTTTQISSTPKKVKHSRISITECTVKYRSIMDEDNYDKDDKESSDDEKSPDNDSDKNKSDEDNNNREENNAGTPDCDDQISLCASDSDDPDISTTTFDSKRGRTEQKCHNKTADDKLSDNSDNDKNIITEIEQPLEPKEHGNKKTEEFSNVLGDDELNDNKTQNEESDDNENFRPDSEKEIVQPKTTEKCEPREKVLTPQNNQNKPIKINRNSKGLQKSNSEEIVCIDNLNLSTQLDERAKPSNKEVESANNVEDNVRESDSVENVVEEKTSGKRHMTEDNIAEECIVDDGAVAGPSGYHQHRSSDSDDSLVEVTPPIKPPPIYIELSSGDELSPTSVIGGGGKVQRGRRRSKQTTVREELRRREVEREDLKDDCSCSICLGPFENRSFLVQCFHSFCHMCIIQWSELSCLCPLCKKKYKSLVHSVTKDLEFEQYIFPEEIKPQDQVQTRPVFENMPGGRRFRYQTTLVDTHTWASRRAQREQAEDGSHGRQRRALNRRLKWSNTKDRRREVYRKKMTIQEVKQAGRPKQRDISCSFFQENPALKHRLVPWLLRDLNVLLGNNDEDIRFVMSLILNLISKVPMEGDEFFKQLQPFLFNETKPFITELVSFASSPYDIRGYDTNVVYEEPLPQLKPPTITSVIIEDDYSSVQEEESLLHEVQPLEQQLSSGGDDEDAVVSSTSEIVGEHLVIKPPQIDACTENEGETDNSTTEQQNAEVTREKKSKKKKKRKKKRKHKDKVVEANIQEGENLPGEEKNLPGEEENLPGEEENSREEGENSREEGENSYNEKSDVGVIDIPSDGEIGEHEDVKERKHKKKKKKRKRKRVKRNHEANEHFDKENDSSHRKSRSRSIGTDKKHRDKERSRSRSRTIDTDKQHKRKERRRSRSVDSRRQRSEERSRSRRKYRSRSRKTSRSRSRSKDKRAQRSRERSYTSRDNSKRRRVRSVNSRRDCSKDDRSSRKRRSYTDREDASIERKKRRSSHKRVKKAKKKHKKKHKKRNRRSYSSSSSDDLKDTERKIAELFECISKRYNLPTKVAREDVESENRSEDHTALRLRQKSMFGLVKDGDTFKSRAEIAFELLQIEKQLARKRELRNRENVVTQKAAADSTVGELAPVVGLNEENPLHNDATYTKLMGELREIEGRLNSCRSTFLQ